MSLYAAMQTSRQVLQGFLEQAHPGTITINGEDYECSIRKSEIEPDLDEKTMTTQMLQRAQVRVLRSLLPACPAASQRVICDGLEWMIEARGAQSSTAVTWLLRLKRIVTKVAA